jgi:hypothetical protein
VILTFCCEEEPDEEWLEGEGHLSSFLQIRHEIGGGDLRSLDLGWLMGVQAEELTASDKEPPVPPNLGALSGPQASLAEFFHLDPGLLAAAAQNSPRLKVQEMSAKVLAAWISSLPVKEKDKMLVRLMAGDASNIGIELQARFRLQRDKVQSPTGVQPRTVAELLSAAKAHGEEHQRGSSDLRRRRSDATRENRTNYGKTLHVGRNQSHEKGNGKKAGSKI